MPYSSAGSSAGGSTGASLDGDRHAGHLGERLPRQREGVRVVVGEVIGDPRDAGVDVAAAELLGRHLLPRGRPHERRATEGRWRPAPAR